MKNSISSDIHSKSFIELQERVLSFHRIIIWSLVIEIVILCAFQI